MRKPLRPLIEAKRKALKAIKPHSHRRVKVERDLVWLVVNQLRAELRMERRAS